MAFRATLLDLVYIKHNFKPGQKIRAIVTKTNRPGKKSDTNSYINAEIVKLYDNFVLAKTENYHITIPYRDILIGDIYVKIKISMKGEMNMCKKEYPPKLKSKKVHNKDCFWCGSEMIRSSNGWDVCVNCGWKYKAERKQI